MGDQSDDRREGVDCACAEFSDSEFEFWFLFSSGRACPFVEVEFASVAGVALSSCCPLAGAVAGDGARLELMSMPTLMLAWSFD